ncbi:hypothetical protein [Arcanobacterium phocae]|uniref:hypothetical protein n=1 Tax=Arcanobacterium phocae TaxID=131112 RepID=UPI001C0EC13B|nr:hypothetical protein [Arcanobacterium phocae]
MISARIIPIWRYHFTYQLRFTGTWILFFLITFLATTQGLITEHAPELLKTLAGPGMSDILATSLPEPSWQESYAGWVKNLAQIVSLAFIVVNALSCARLSSGGDIPFILTRNVRRSDYLGWATFTVWALTVFLAFLGATFMWLGTLLLFPGTPYIPILTATLVWALQMIIIYACQVLATTWKSSVGSPLIVGLGVYFFIAIAGMWDKAANYTPLGLGKLTDQLAQNAPAPLWLWPILTSALLIGLLTSAAIHRFNRIELD